MAAVVEQAKSTMASFENSKPVTATSLSLHTHRQNHNSSKLPAFRFVDLKKDSQGLPQQPSLQPPSPPDSNDPASTPDDPPQSQTSVINEKTQPATHTAQNPQKPVAKPTTSAEPTTSQLPRSRASTLQTSTPRRVPTTPGPAKRPASFPDTPTLQGSLSVSDTASKALTGASATAKPPARRAPASFSAHGVETSAGPPPALNNPRLHVAVDAAQTSDRTTKEWAKGQRELLLPSLQQTSPTDEKRHSKPPVSFKPISVSTSASTPVRVPPIRKFRSSGSRRSLILDMNTRPMRPSDLGDDVSDSNQRDRTLRALEGRPDDDMLQMTPPDSADREGLEGDDTGDLFLKIAREESVRRMPDENPPTEEPSAVARVVRSTHRRPLSAAIPSYQPTSPPRISRRMSDQQDTQRTSKLEEDPQADSIARLAAYRSLARDKAASVHPGEDLGRARIASAVLRPSPLATRPLGSQDISVDNSIYGRRRSSITEGTAGLQRASSYRQSNLAYGHSRTYNPSPLVQASHSAEGTPCQEGTESSASTAAPSTVWDELDDIKSRIHRLELTGKLPATSGAAMSRLSDERPATATTTVTTVSTSPKQASGNGTPQGQGDASSTTSSQKEHPLLQAALTKSKLFVGSEVFKALEAAASDATTLSSMMGTAGQPGPISSGASTIGGLGTTVTDRALRRKADSVCRSLTELCLALSEDASAQAKSPQSNTTPQKDTPTTPTVPKSFAGLAAQRRGSLVGEPGLARSNISPRTLTSLEQRRTSLLNASALPSPRLLSSTPSTPAEPVGRKSSLFVARARRAGTEEPPDEGRKSSLLLRTRRAGTEEPEEGRKTSLLLRRRGTVGDEEEQRAPSRAATEVASPRVVTQTPTPDTMSLGQSALPRRRLVPSNPNSRLATPSTPTGIAGRRYLSTADRDGNSVAGKLAEDRGQRQLSLNQTAVLNRTSSVNRRQQKHESAATNPQNGASTGTYRS